MDTIFAASRPAPCSLCRQPEAIEPPVSRWPSYRRAPRLLVGGLVFSMALAVAPFAGAMADEEPVDLLTNSLNVQPLTSGGSSKVTVGGTAVALSPFAMTDGNVRTGTLKSAVFGASSIRLPLNDGTVAVAVRDREVQREGGSVTWIGHFPDHFGSVLVITSHKGVVSGYLHRGAETYEIRPGAAGEVVFYAIDTSQLPEESEIPPAPEEATDAPEESGFNVNPLAVNEASGPMVERLIDSVQDLLVVYTETTANTRPGGAAALEAAILSAVEEANQAYLNSGVTIQLNLVGMQQVDYPDTLDVSLTLDRLQAAGDGYLDDVHMLRNSTGADLVALISVGSPTRSGGGTCGIGYLMRRNDGSSVNSAFSVTREDCLVGKTLAHELGHNQGNMHDRANSDQNGIYPYSFGHRRCTDDETGFRDIMSYNNNCFVERINYFSNPAVLYNGYATGVDHVLAPNNSADTARSMNLTGPTIQAYRVTTRVPVAPGVLSTNGLLSDRVTLEWYDRSTEEKGYRLERSSNGVTFTEIATLGPNARTYTSTGLTSGTNYWYRVRAYNGAGNSEYSNTLSVRTPDPTQAGYLPRLSVQVFEAGLGYRSGPNSEPVGIRSKGMVTMLSMGLTGNDAPGLQIEYMCRVNIKGAIRDTAWLQAGQLCGIATSTGNVSIYGYAVRLTGAAAAWYTVEYWCPSWGGTTIPVKANGQFCASPKGILGRTLLDYVQVRVVRKPCPDAVCWRAS